MYKSCFFYSIHTQYTFNSIQVPKLSNSQCKEGTESDSEQVCGVQTAELSVQAIQ